MKKQMISIVTGGSRGVGSETAKLLSRNGHIVYSFSRSIPNALKDSSHEKLNYIKLDITNHKCLENKINQILDEHGRVDNLILNANIVTFGAIEEVSLSQMRYQFEVCVFSHIYLIQKILPKMRKNNCGKIIFIGSTSGRLADGMYASYCAAKFAIEALAEALKQNLTKWHISVSIVELSATNTDLIEKGLVLGDRFKNSTENPYMHYTSKNLSSLRKILSEGESPEEIAKVIFQVINEKHPKFRYFATPYSRKVFGA